MKKQIALILTMLFLGAGVAGAADFSLSGNYFVEGDYLNFNQWTAYKTALNPANGKIEPGTAEDKNDPATPTNPLDDTFTAGNYDKARSYGAYTHELSVDATIAMSEATKIFTRFEMRDEDWSGRGSSFNEGTTTGKEADDNIVVEQVYASHTFGNGSNLAVGLMPAGAWGTTFNDNLSEEYRVKYTVPTSVGTIVGILEKSAEGGNITQGEDNDTDVYYLAGITKLGDVYVKPLLGYAVKSNANPASDLTKTVAILALDGVFGNIGFEAEGRWNRIDMKQETPAAKAVDYTEYGLYGNVWLTQNALKAGILGAYGSYDKQANQGFDFGDDFSAGGALIMGNHITFLNNPNDLSAGHLIAGYFDYALNDKLSVGGYLGHATCGASDNGIWDGASVSEISGDVTYKITQNLTYTVAAGTAKFQWGDSTTPDPKQAILVGNTLSFSF